MFGKRLFSPPKQIIVQFSASIIVTGTPALKLETGVADREASWVNTTNSNSTAGEDGAVALEVDSDDSMLLFEYIVVTGDSADDLDYWCDEEVCASKNMCFWSLSSALKPRMSEENQKTTWIDSAREYTRL